MNLEELFTELKNKKDNNKIATNIIVEINNRIEAGEFTFTNNQADEIYLYMYLCNKLEIKDTLNKLINDKDFIKVLDSTKIDGSILPSLTDICDKPRKCLIKNSKKLKESILKGKGLLSAEDILADLTTEEIKLLREDLEIDNFLISHGLSFDTLKEETIKRLLSDASIFSVYSIYTINDFANSYKNKEELLDNEVFFDIYIDKLNDEYHYDNKIFKLLTIDKVKEILAKSPSLHVLLHLLKDTKDEVQQLLLNNKEIIDYLNNCVDVEILVKIPKNKLLKLLKERKNLLQGANLKVLETLNKKELQKLFQDNKNLYEELLDSISTQAENTLKFLINSLPDSYLKDLCENRIKNLDLTNINKLLKTENEEIRKAILRNTELCTNIINSTTSKTFGLLEELLKVGRYTGEEVVKIINNLTTVKDSKTLNKLIDIVPLSLRKDLYSNSLIKDRIYKEEDYELDNYAFSQLLNNLTELKKQPARIIATVLNSSDITFIEQALSDDSILEKIFSNQEATDEIINILTASKKLIPLLKRKNILANYSKESIQNILNNLSLADKNNLCTNDIIRKLVDNNEDAFNLYKKLSNNNRYILNTLNFNFLSIPNLSEVKLTNLELITKYPELQEDIVIINKSFNIVPNFLNGLLYNTNKLSFEKTISKCLRIIRETTEGLNRKKYGNISKMLLTYNEELSKKEYKTLVNYLLYLIPRYKREKGTIVERPIVIDTPNSFNEVLKYENNFEQKLTQLIANCPLEEIKNYFVMKHFKLTLEEASIMLNMYSIDRIDNTIYRQEYEMLSDLNKVMNTDSESLREMDEKYYTLSMYDSFVIEKQIKDMYGKIYNFEIRSKTYSNQPFTKTIYGKEIQIYNCPNDFLFLISNVDIKEEFEYTNSYFEAWHNTLNKLPNGISTSLIANDNFVIKEDIIFGFNGVLDEGILKMSNLNSCVNCQNNTKEKYMTPCELIDNTRDVNNTIVIDRFAVRPNYNNSNIPNIEPDFILVDSKKLEDNQYLEMISRASEEFKSKRNKNGLPIIAYDIDKISSNEASKIKSQINKYLKKYDMNMLHSILTKLENNYTAYRTTNAYVAEKFLLDNLLCIIKDRVTKTNSLAELEYLEELFTREYQKYNALDKELSCNYSLKDLSTFIKEKVTSLNRQ